MALLKSILFLPLALLSSGLAWSQNEPEKDVQNVRYLGIAALTDYTVLRDLGVSPLNYDGLLLGGTGALVFEGPRWDLNFEGGVGQGDLQRVKVGTYTSSVLTFFYAGHVLRRFWQNEKENLDFKAGLQFGGYSSQRQTPAFLNAGTVWESLNSAFLSGKMTWNIRKQQSAGKLFFIKKKAGTRHYKLSTQLSLPLLHTAWRPGYAYLDDFTDGDTKVYENNEFKTGGFRIHWRSEFTYFLLNGNGFRLGYTWDAQKTAGQINPLELTHHYLQTAVLIRLN
jgi:hypothetical protein